MALNVPTEPRAARSESRTLFASGLLRIGAFRCSVQDPGFATAGPISRPHFVFPRTSVWILHEGAPAFAADPGIVTLYNGDRSYSRAPLSREGDRSDWYEVSPELVRDVAAEANSAARDDPEHPFRAAWVPGSPDLYWSQRRLFERLATGEPVEALEVEEGVASLLSAVLSGRARSASLRIAPTGPETPRSRALAQAARAELDLRFAEDISLSRLAARLDASYFALCRAFRAHFGTTLHAHRLQVRLQAALEPLASGESDLTRLALDLGFSSHSHFTLCFRRTFGVTPSEARSQLRRGGHGRSTPLHGPR
ncbi:MAG: helix-turn-helix transcriptional regulator [Chloroflexi bacterium]|nr:helix-turn-helix transcriptional regulator [Chloroflexota bacterium]